MVLFIDNYDSFSFNLVDLLEQTGIKTVIVENDDPYLLNKDLKCDGIVISPGPGRPENSGYLMPFLEKHHKRVPILGICLGMQAIGCFFGAKLSKGIKPVHGKVSEIMLSDHYLFSDMPEKISVTRYHSLVLKELPDELIPISKSKIEKEIMGITHIKWPICGVQFHPEAVLSEFGLDLVENWVHQNKILS